ncbi:hypothetical protein [Devosia naphthalenivorans]|uniref:hypothetical protein n=1 Tax=Devosia naphthalenivorans TaxID=2082392 RepID=UPI000D360B6E|nr:hypothetical protein [Devosia naphthalenivorans]
MKSKVHVICRKEPGTKYKGLDTIDPRALVFESRAWRLKPEDTSKLIGGLFCLHAAKADRSSYGGEIIEINFRPQEDNGGEVMAVVKFRADKEAIGLAWPDTNNPNEFLRVDLP